MAEPTTAAAVHDPDSSGHDAVTDERDADPIGRGEHAPSANLTQRTVAGLRWSYLSAGSNAILQIGYVAAMSRILSPREFGIVAMAGIVVNFGQFFTRMGVAQTLVQHPRITDDDVRASATSSALLGLCCATGGFLVAPWVADLYRTPEVVPVLRGLCGTFVFLGLGITSAGLLRRQMRFRELALIEIAGAVAGVTVGLSLAVGGAGVWSLVAAWLTTSAVTAALQYLGARHSVRPLLAWRQLAPLYRSGTRFSFLRLTEFLGRNLDTVAVGRFTTTASTGVYSRAYTLVTLPLQRYLALAFAKVLFPSFASIQDDRPRLRRAVSSALLVAGLVLVPTGAAMSAAAPELVAVALGDQFEAAAPLVPFFTIASVLFVLSHLAQLVCEAVADLNRTIAVQVGSLGLLLCLLAAAAGRDLWVFAAALAVTEAVRHVAYLVLLRRLVGLDMAAVRQTYLPIAVVGAIVGAVVMGARLLLTDLGVAALPVLLVEILVAGMALGASIRFTPHHVRRQLRRRFDAAARRPSGTLARAVRRLLLGADSELPA